MQRCQVPSGLPWNVSWMNQVFFFNLPPYDIGGAIMVARDDVFSL